MTKVHAAINLLTDTMLSHLSYEERELIQPLARLGYYWVVPGPARAGHRSGPSGRELRRDLVDVQY